MRANIKRNELTRVVIVGGGLGGLRLALSFKKTNFQVVLIDKNNYNQFPPLIYQVASAGLEPSNISFPFRRLFQGRKNFFYRMGTVLSVDHVEKAVQTTFGTVHYDYLVLAAGATTNFFGNKDIEAHVLPMKTVTESMRLRNTIFENLERAEIEDKEERRQAYMNVVVVGGGPSGVEISGALADMRKMVVPRDYPELDASKLHIYLVDSGDRLIKGMDERSSSRALYDLRCMGVEVVLQTRVLDYKNGVVQLSDGREIPAKTVVWVSGVKANTIEGLAPESQGHANRIITDRYCAVKGMENIYAIGDCSIMEGDPEYPMGHPQLAQVALQQADLVSKNIRLLEKGEQPNMFRYKNLGCMATIGRRKAVVEIGKFKFGGFFAWILWLVVHIRSILGVKNKASVFANWMWNYVNYTQSLRLILKTHIQ